MVVISLGGGVNALYLCSAVKKNRKKSETYRLNGYPHSNPKSIHSVGIGQLETWIREYIAKLADPNDPDDKKWTARWLKRFETERDKKLKGLVVKIRGGKKY